MAEPGEGQMAAIEETRRVERMAVDALHRAAALVQQAATNRADAEATLLRWRDPGARTLPLMLGSPGVLDAISAIVAEAAEVAQRGYEGIALTSYTRLVDAIRAEMDERETSEAQAAAAGAQEQAEADWADRR